MAERSSGSSAKRTRAPRRRINAEGDSLDTRPEDSAASIRAEHESSSARPVIDDVLDEVRAVRSSADAADDFGAGLDNDSAPPPRRPRAAKPPRAAAPRSAAPRATRSSASRTPAPPPPSAEELLRETAAEFQREENRREESRREESRREEPRREETRRDESRSSAEPRRRSVAEPTPETVWSDEPSRSETGRSQNAGYNTARPYANRSDSDRGIAPRSEDFSDENRNEQTRSDQNRGDDFLREFDDGPSIDSRGPDSRGSDFRGSDSRDAGLGYYSAEGAPQEGGAPNDGGDPRRRRRRRGRGGRGGEQGTGGNYSGGGQRNSRGGGGGGGGGGGRGPHSQSNNRRSGGNNFRNDRNGPPRRDHRNDNRGPDTFRGPDNRSPEGDQANRGPETIQPAYGVLELHPKGYGFLRDAKFGYTSQPSDVFVSSTHIEKFGLREGVLILGECTVTGRGQGPRLKSIEQIEGKSPEDYALIRSFDDLTAVSPHEQIKLETGPTPITMRVMDLLTPIGKGQRALIVAPPRSGKTMLLQEIADSVSTNHPEIHLIVLLIDERPEEVTEMRRRVRGEVIASSMDREVESHVRVSQLIFERAKRMAEAGKDVFILLDSITRTARAFNKWTGNTGRTMSGGLDVKAMDIPKKMFGQARRFEEGGSLTVVGTALVDTGSRMDEVIFQEFKGTGNMELVLSRDLADRRIWPAIDISKSGTRREEKILTPEVLEGVIMLRRSLVSLSPVEAMEQLSRILAKYKTNTEFLSKIKAML